MQSILDSKFKYTPAAQTDLRKTFARIRRDQKLSDTKQEAERLERIAKIRPMQRVA